MSAFQDLEGVPASSLVCIEVFCGKAQLSKSLRAKSFQTFSIDHKTLKNVPILRLDLNSELDVKLLMDLLDQARVLYVHFAPPCGTASAARNIRLSRKRHGPRPLRSISMPMGLRGLKAVDRERVRLANSLYSMTCKLVEILQSRGIGWSIENPASSLMWMTTPFQQLAMRLRKQLIGLVFDTCMYGSSRLKHTALWTNVPHLKALAVRCDNSHEHEAWGQVGNKFATALECAYNKQLSDARAACVQQFALSCNVVFPPTVFSEVTSEESTLRTNYNKAVLGTQPRGRKLPPVMTDLLQGQSVDITAYPEVQRLPQGSRLPNTSVFPAGSRLLRHENVNGGERDDEADDKTNAKSAIIGFPRTPEDYLAEVITLQHPHNSGILLDDEMVDAIRLQLDGGSAELRRQRIAWAKEVSQLRIQLNDEELELHKRMPQHLQSVLSTKRLKLFEKLLVDSNYQDSKIASEMTAGFNLVGWAPQSGVFESKVRPPTMHPDVLRKMAASFTARSIASLKTSGDELQDLELWKATMKEVDAGFIEGPLRRRDLPRGAVVSPRFGLWQKEKLRPIDNFTASGVNLTVGLSERLRVDTIDDCGATIKRWMQMAGGSCKLVGRTYDLRKAYRQLGVAESDLDCAWIGVWSPIEGEAMFFRMKSLPFGATSAVASFLRVAHAIRHVGTTAASLVWTSYFDDYIVVCRPEDATSTDLAVRHLFGALGWQLSEDEKDCPFSDVFSALGVSFDLRGCPKGYFEIGNTQSRKDELSARVDAILKADELDPQLSMSLRSRFLFAESQVYGRVAKHALRCVGQPALDSRTFRPLTSDIIFHLNWLKERVLLAPPRKISVEPRETFFLFLDGACTEHGEGSEWTGTSIGGVLFGQIRHDLCFKDQLFLAKATPSICDLLGQQFAKTSITASCLVALRLWEKVLAGKSVFVFIDNEAARAAWINAAADSEFASRMVRLGVSKEADLDLIPYFCRVPTFSNLADGPSRGQFDLSVFCGAERIRVRGDLLSECAGLYST